MTNPTTNCRIYPENNGWLLKHRGTKSTAEAIKKLIEFHERVKGLIKDGGMS